MGISHGDYLIDKKVREVGQKDKKDKHPTGTSTMKRQKSTKRRTPSLTLEEIFSPPNGKGKKWRKTSTSITSDVEDGEKNTLFEFVPLEILARILGELPGYNSWFNAALVCKRWARAFTCNTKFFRTRKFVTYAMHINPSAWDRLGNHDATTITLPPTMMDPYFFMNAAKFIKSAHVFSAVLNTSAFESSSPAVVESMVNGAIIEDNQTTLGILIAKNPKSITSEAFLFACQSFHKFPGKSRCLSLIISNGIADGFLRSWPIAQILVDHRLHLSIEKLSKRAAFYRNPACCWFYVRYAIKQKKEDLLRRILVRGNIDITAQDNAILKKCCQLGWHRMVPFLLDLGADPAANNQEALKRACASSNGMSVVKALLKHEHVNPGHNMNEVVRKALQLGNDTVAATLISHPKVNPLVYDSPSNSLLCLSAKHLCPKSMEAIFKTCPSIDPNQEGHYPIRRSITQQFMNGLRILVKHPKLKLEYDEMTHILSICSYVSDTQLPKMLLRSKQFSNVFENNTPTSEEEENHSPMELGEDDVIAV